jgi:hypothetical protein
MRNLLLPALVAVAVLAAGCSAPVHKDPGAVDVDPTSSGAEGIASGEPHPGSGGANGGMLVRPDHEDNSSDDLRLVGDESASGFTWGGQVTFTFNATNLGGDATTRGACEVPYAFTLRDANGTEHPLDAPMGHCLALSIDPFPHGASMEFGRTWNGTYADGDHLQWAAAGHYTLQATFTASRDGHAAHVQVTMPVNVIADRGQL